MPELPEVEAICARLRLEIAGARISAVDVLRSGATRPQSPAVLELAAGRRILSVERRAKNVVLRLSGGWAIRIHLRMTGDLCVLPDIRVMPATARVVFRLGAKRGLVFDDPRALGRVHLHRTEELDRLLAALGPEPLGSGFTAACLAGIARSSRQPAKLFLLDQTRIAGLGNIYAAEALFRAGIHPARPACRLRGDRIRRLHDAIVGVLRDAVQSAGAAYARPGVFQDAEAFRCAVYGREGEPCPTCGRKIRRISQGGRSTYFCPGCQV